MESPPVRLPAAQETLHNKMCRRKDSKNTKEFACLIGQPSLILIKMMERESFFIPAEIATRCLVHTL